MSRVFAPFAPTFFNLCVIDNLGNGCMRPTRGAQPTSIRIKTGGAGGGAVDEAEGKVCLSSCYSGCMQLINHPATCSHYHTTQLLQLFSAATTLARLILSRLCVVASYLRRCASLGSTRPSFTPKKILHEPVHKPF